MKFTVTDGFVTKEIEAQTGCEAAMKFALVPCMLTVTDEEGYDDAIEIIETKHGLEPVIHLTVDCLD